MLKSLGADKVIHYHTMRFEDVVHDVDVVLDTQAGDTQRKIVPGAEEGGVLVSTLGIEDPGLAGEVWHQGDGFHGTAQWQGA